MRRINRYRRIFRYIVREVQSELRSVLQNPKVRRFFNRLMNVAIGLSVVSMSVWIITENASRPVPEDCGALLIAIPMGIAYMFKL